MEAELNLNMLEDFPALIRCSRNSRIITGGAELELGI
jgi:hypothetical protein